MVKRKETERGNVVSSPGKSAVALAIGLGLGVCNAQQAEAVIIHSSDTGFIPITISDDSAALDMNADGTTDFVLYHYFGPESAYWAGVQTYSSAVVAEDIDQYRSYAKDLEPGYSVGPGNSFYPNYDDGRSYIALLNVYGYSQKYKFGNFLDADGYMGLRIDIEPEPETGLPSFLYGWAKILVDPSFDSITLQEWAYQDDGSPIAVGQNSSEVPLPSSLLLLATGAAGLAGIRRRWQGTKRGDS